MAQQIKQKRLVLLIVACASINQESCLVLFLPSQAFKLLLFLSEARIICNLDAWQTASPQEKALL
jgi:hypothetical protein